MYFWKKWFEPKPFNSGYLPEDGGHFVFFSEYGNPKGEPILVFHGGPGGSAKPKHTTFADLKKYRVILFDQRGGGKSQPLGRLENNTTEELLKDAQRLLDYLHISEPIIIRGGSWGSTLALLFAQKHPHKVKKLLLSQVFLPEQQKKWEFEDMYNFYPEFIDELRKNAQNQPIAAYYATLINSDDPAKQLKAANEYGYYERLCGSLNPSWGKLELMDEAELASQRIYLHYAAHQFMLEGKSILEKMAEISHISAVVVHNRLDFSCPFKGAYLIHKSLENSRLVVVPERGHVGDLLYKTMDYEFRKELAA